MTCTTQALNGRTCAQRGAMCTDKLQCERIGNYERVMNAPIQPYFIEYAEPEPLDWLDRAIAIAWRFVLPWLVIFCILAWAYVTVTHN